LTPISPNPVQVVFTNGVALINDDYTNWYISTDGFKTFNELTLPTEIYSRVTSLTVLNGIFIALGGYGLLATSTDGTTWDILKQGIVSPPIGLFAYKGMFLYPTQTAGEGVQNGVIYSSEDGMTWDEFLTIPNLVSLDYDNGLEAFIVYNGTFTDGFVVQTTQDFDKWQQVKLPDDYVLGFMTFGNNIWTIGGYSTFGNFIVTSSDVYGTRWSQTYDAGSGYLLSTVFANGYFFCTNPFTNQLVQSQDGQEWINMLIPSACESPVITNPNDNVVLLCLGGTSGYILTAPNVWTRAQFPANFISLTYLSNGVYVGIDNSYAAWYSKDLKVWNMGPVPASKVFDTYMNTVVYNNGIYLGSGSIDLWTST